MKGLVKERFKKYCAVASDCSPIESPVIFSPIWFAAKYIKGDWPGKPLLKKIFEYSKFSIPYSYSASLPGGKRRELNLLHPAGQLRMAEFFSQNSIAIIDRCSKSSYSLRRPVKPNKLKKYSERLRFDRSIGDTQLIGPMPLLFSYERFNRLYKFHGSDEFLSLERQFPLMVELDIKKCFYSIYTHTVSWAVKDRKEAKRTIQNRASFENRLDKLFQLVNYNETSGIVVGPETSRVFSEIILQDVDKLVERDANKKGFSIGVDYAIKRYIDNYYIFCEDDHCKRFLEDSIEKRLREYRLYLNSEKRINYKRPFTTTESRFSAELHELITRFLDDLASDIALDNPRWPALLLATARSRQFTAKRFISEYRMIISRYELEDGFQATHVFGALRKFLQRVRARPVVHLSKADQAFAEQRLGRDFCLIVHHLFCVGPNVAALELSVDCLISLGQASVVGKNVVQKEVRSVIDSMFREVFMRRGALAKCEAYPLEFVYFLPLLQIFECETVLDEEQLIAVFLEAESACSHNNSLPYWQVVAFLYYAQGRDFNSLVETIVSSVNRSLSGVEFIAQADICLAILDVIRCPSITPEARTEILKNLQRKLEVQLDDREVAHMLNDEMPWFVDWDLDVNLKNRIASRRLFVDLS